MALDRYPTNIEAGILHLPDLVMHRICTFFCKHCESPSLGEEDAPEHLTHRGQATLLNLCRVAKFHYNAQRILYHNIDIQIPRNYLQRPLEDTIGLLTSLRINPHLKNLVKSLSIQDVPWAGPGHCHVRETCDNPPLPESLLNDLRTLSHGLRIPLCNVQLEKKKSCGNIDAIDLRLWTVITRIETRCSSSKSLERRVIYCLEDPRRS